YKVSMSEEEIPSWATPVPPEQRQFQGPIAEQDFIEAQNTDPYHLAQLKFRAEEAEKELAASEEAKFDKLTGLLLPDAFKKEVGAELAKFSPDRRRSRSRVNCALIAQMDLKGLKAANDGPGGHQSGDRILRNLSELIKSVVRLDEGDRVSRLGGDEFGLAIFFRDDEITLEDMEASFDARMMKFVRERVAAGDIPGLRWNVAFFQQGKTIEELLHEADPVEELHPGKVREFPSRADMPGRIQSAA
ncbi:MAG: putative diguanylate cyclase, partial [Candidatus Saccharibacteria bacterium]|nr:putative diguanylate cyclase [Candidatus Saccharibacteria bacterium]